MTFFFVRPLPLGFSSFGGGAFAGIPAGLPPKKLRMSEGIATYQL
jgi:hypothetical protein